MPGRNIYDFGVYRFDAERRQLRRLDNKPLKILKQRGETREADLGRPRSALLRAFLEAAAGSGGREVLLSEERLIRAAWAAPNKTSKTALATLKRTLRDVQKILKDHDPRERHYIKRLGNAYTLAVPAKKLSPLEIGRMHAPPEDDEWTKEAKKAFEWGRRLLDTFTTEGGLQTAIQQFRKAYDILPDFAAAYAYESFAHLWLSIYSWRAPKVSLPPALDASALALRHDKTLGVAHTARGLSMLFNEADKAHRWAEAEELFKNGIELDRKYGQKFEVVYQMDAVRLTARKQFTKARQAINRSMEINPVSFTSLVLEALVRFVSRDYQSCHNFLQQIIALEDDIDAAYYIRVLTYIYKGEPQKAFEEINRGREMARGNILYELLLAYWQGMFDSKAMAVKTIEELDRKSERRYVSPYHRALPFVHIDAAQAVERLEHSAREKDPWVVMLGVDPRVDLLRQNTRFKALLRRLGLDGAP